MPASGTASAAASSRRLHQTARAVASGAPAAAPAAVARPAAAPATAARANHHVVIVGSGFSGMLCATYLKEAGVDNLCIFEMTPAVGGVWSKGGVGAYPGAACDVPAYSYLPFLDRTGYVPSKKYVNQTEISEYAELLTDHTGIRDSIVFERKVTDIKYIGGEGDAVWEVTTVHPSTGEIADVVTCMHVVSANGPLSSPRLPEIAGMEDFQGESFHTAAWDKTASLAGKKVGVVGTGASAAQVITSIVDDVSELVVFQRTPTWCLPRNDEPTPDDIREQFESGAGYGESLRVTEWEGDGQTKEGGEGIDFNVLHDPEANAQICAGLKMGIDAQVKDPELAARLTPDYPFFCKRALFIDDYYTTYNKPHVALVDDEGGVVGVDKTGLSTASGVHVELDVIIYATGFDSNFIPFNVEGKDGQTLADKFGANEANNFQMTRPQSLWGIHVADMPYTINPHRNMLSGGWALRDCL